MKLLYQWRIQGGAWVPPPPTPHHLIFRQNRKMFFYFEIGPPTYLTGWMTAPLPPPPPTPYLKGLDPPLFITERFHQFNGVFGRSHE